MEFCEDVARVVDVVGVTNMARLETELLGVIGLEEIVELEEDTEIVNRVELLDVVGPTELRDESFCVVVIELDCGVDDDDVVLEKARGAKGPKKFQLSSRSKGSDCLQTRSSCHA